MAYSINAVVVRQPKDEIKKLLNIYYLKLVFHHAKFSTVFSFDASQHSWYWNKSIYTYFKKPCRSEICNLKPERNYGRPEKHLFQVWNQNLLFIGVCIQYLYINFLWATNWKIIHFLSILNENLQVHNFLSVTDFRSPTDNVVWNRCIS